MAKIHKSHLFRYKIMECDGVYSIYFKSKYGLFLPWEKLNCSSNTNLDAVINGVKRNIEWDEKRRTCKNKKVVDFSLPK